MGPIEGALPETGGEVLHRYIYDSGAGVAWRETYRYPSQYGFDTTRTDVTCRVPISPGTMAYLDDDEVVDLRVADREGGHLLWYRAREGTASEGQLPVTPCHRGTGILNPPNLPAFEYMEFQPFYQRVIEDDILAGRRGLAAWDGRDYDAGLFVGYYEPPSARLAGDRPWWQYALVIGGAIIAIVGGIVLIALSGGMAAPAVGIAWAKLAVLAVGVGLFLGGSTAATSLVMGASPGQAALTGTAVALGAAAATFTGGALLQLMAPAVGLGVTGGSAFAPAGLALGEPMLSPLQATAAMSIAGAVSGYYSTHAYYQGEGAVLGRSPGESFEMARTPAMINAGIGFGLPWAFAGAGGVRNWWMRGSENDAYWRSLSWRDRLRYEMGQMTLPGDEFRQFRGVRDPIERWNSIVGEFGNGGVAARTNLTLGIGRTFLTGPTPGVRWFVPRAAAVGGAAWATAQTWRWLRRRRSIGERK